MSYIVKWHQKSIRNRDDVIGKFFDTIDEK